MIGKKPFIKIGTFILVLVTLIFSTFAIGSFLFSNLTMGQEQEGYYDYVPISPNQECDDYDHCKSHSTYKWMIDVEDGEYKPFTSLVNLTWEEGTIKITYKNNSYYYVKFAPFFIYNGQEYDWQTSRAFMQNQGIDLDVIINKQDFSYKYGINFTSIPENVGNNIDYIGLELVESSGLNWNDIERRNQSLIIKDKIRMDYSDLLSSGFTLNIVNKSRILIGNISANIIDGVLWLDPDTGLKSPGAYGDDYNDWSLPERALSLDDSYAYPSNPTVQQDYYNFSFGVPEGATIDGINITIEGHAYSTSLCRIFVELSHDGGSTYTSSFHTVDFYGTTDYFNDTGGPTDTWGRSWSSSEFSNVNFRVLINGTGGQRTYVDHLQVIIHYTVGETTPPTWQDIVENTADPATYTYSPNYGFQINFTDETEMSEVLMGHNVSGSFVNTTCTNVSVDIYYCNVTSMPVGVLNYTFYGNDTTDNQNRTDYNTFTVSKADPSSGITSSGTSPITYPTASDWIGSETNDGDSDCSYTFTRNGTVIPSPPDTTILAVGVHNYSYNTSGCVNYTAGMAEDVLIVNSLPLMIYQWAEVFSYNNTHITYNLTVFVINNHTATATNILVTPDSDYGGPYTLSGLATRIANITQVGSHLFTRGVLDANYTIDAPMLGNNYTGTGNILQLINPIDPPSAQVLKAVDTCTPPVSGDWEVLCCDNCTKEDLNIDVKGILRIYGADEGTFIVDNVNLSFEGYQRNATNCVIIKHPPYKWIQKGN